MLRSIVTVLPSIGIVTLTVTRALLGSFRLMTWGPCCFKEMSPLPSPERRDMFPVRRTQRVNHTALTRAIRSANGKIRPLEIQS